MGKFLHNPELNEDFAHMLEEALLNAELHGVIQFTFFEQDKHYDNIPYFVDYLMGHDYFPLRIGRDYLTHTEDEIDEYIRIVVE